MGIIGFALLIIIVIASALLGSWVFLSDRKSKINIWFGLIAITIALWNIFAYIGYNSTDTAQSVTYFRLNFIAVCFYFIAFYEFTNFFPVKSRRNSVFINLPIVATLLYFAGVSIYTDKIIKDVYIPAPGKLVMDMGEYGNYFYVFTILLTIYIVYVLLKENATLSKVNQDQVRLFLVGTFIYAICNAIFSIGTSFVYTQNYNYTQLGDFSGIFFLGFTAYAIIKNHLFDVKSAIVRSVTYALVLSVLAFIYLLAASLISILFNKSLASPEQIVIGVSTGLILAFAFQPIRMFFDKVTNRVFYKDRYSREDFYAQISETLNDATDLRSLLEQVSNEIGDTLKSEQTFFFINTSDGHYVTAGTPNHRDLPKLDAVKIGEYCNTNSNAIVASSLEPDNAIRRLMLSHRIEIILPLIKSDAIIGYLCLGEHQVSRYTERDVRVINAIADELVIAVQHALAVQEIRELNATLQQRIDNATRELRASNQVLRQLDKDKDEFVSMASHQLRTPLTSIKGYISMILDGDAGEISDMQKQFLDKVSISSERMVRLIDDFLNVSRIQTGKFIIDKHPVDLIKVVAQEIDGLRQNATAHSLTLEYNPPASLPLIDIDEGKVRQVIMNFIDNAIYYSHENTAVTVSLVRLGNTVSFAVKDTGIGVPVNERADLFTKFYRASNARKQRPDGTGVGLYLAKKIIDAHGGKVMFESSEGQGSTFGFSLPLPVEPPAA